MGDDPNTVRIKAHGPYACNGDFAVAGVPPRAGGTLVLCRCGGSGNKPFCDSSHRKVGVRG